LRLDVVLILLFMALFALWLLYREQLLKQTKMLVIALLLLFAAFGGRYLLIGYESGDYRQWLSWWMEHFRDNGGFLALRYPVGNYNMPYLYFLALFSYIPIRDLYLITLLSTLFDVIMAWYVMRLVGLFTECQVRKFAAFFAVLLLPTVVLNSSMWGQCDSIFTAFLVMSVFYALSKRPSLSVITVTIAFAFKLQAIFLMPIFFIFLVKRYVKIRHLLLFPAVYLLTALPAILFGREPVSTILFYLYQAGTVGTALTNNAPSIFTLTITSGLNPLAPAHLVRLGIMAGFVFIFAVYAITCRPKVKLTKEMALLSAFVLSLGVPFFLPHMHDRYFYTAEVLAVAVGMVWLPKLVLIPLTQFASLLAYHFFLAPGGPPRILPLQWGALAMGIALLLGLWPLWRGCVDFPRRKSLPATPPGDCESEL